MLSPALAAVLSPPPPPEVELPEELDQRFRTRAPRHDDSAAIADLYTDDAILAFSLAFLGRPTNWVRGRQPIASFVARAFRGQYALTPRAYRIDDSTGYIAGSLSGLPRHFEVLMSLRRSAGVWRIAAQSVTHAPRPALEPITADDLVAQLDAAGIRRAVVLSLAYLHGSPAIRGDDEYDQVRRENDWTADQVARHPDRLRAFCSLNPLRDYALAELERCAKDPRLRHGLKLHFANSQVDLRKADHVEQLRRIFAAANARRMPIVVHLWTGNDRMLAPYGAKEARVFLNEILPAAPDVPVQVAHLGGPGRLDRGSREALEVFASAVAAGDPRTRKLYFDVATTVTVRTTAEEAEFIAASVRRIGLDRILYGSDMAIGSNAPARESWGAFRATLPLTEAEFRTIADNVAPHMR